MYLRILKKDLKRKRTMNIILLIFIILAATFIASSVNNMLSVVTAIDNFFEMAEVPDYFFCTFDSDGVERFKKLADEKGYDYRLNELLGIDAKDVYVGEKRVNYSNALMLSTLRDSIKIYDSSNREVAKIDSGDIYLPAKMFFDESLGLEVNDKMTITVNGITKTFTVRDYIKDAVLGSQMVGNMRFFISDADFDEFVLQSDSLTYFINIYTDDASYHQNFIDLEINTVFDEDMSTLRMMYILDMIIAAIMLVVSICLVLISMLLLRFTINFTMSEELREIGVMKAIGLKCADIRRLYIAKYSAISAIGAAVGFALSIPFSRLMLDSVSRNIVIESNSGVLLNFICAVAVMGIVVAFCYLCTGKIKKISPIEAIRSGQSGERFRKKSIISLGNIRLSPVLFMAANDILSEVRRFVSMLIIFALGLLLIILPVNTINTLQSDKLIGWFNMADCDQVISTETILNVEIDNKSMLEDELNKVRRLFDEKSIKARIFQETLFRVNISNGSKKISSLAFLGIGDVTAADYTYLEGTPPQNNNEIALTAMTAGKIDADIGDEIEIKNGDVTKKYIITALFQSMNNLGEGVRFYQNEDIDYNYMMGYFGIQIKYDDNPNADTLSERQKMLEEQFSEGEIYTAGEYINYMIGDVAGQLGSIRQLILVVVLVINALVTVLMVRSFITKEWGEIAILKAVGFKNSALVAWQSVRIAIVLVISVIFAVLLSTPLSQLLIGPIFKMMGAQSIEFEIIPLEVYVYYPLIILSVTVFSGMLSALRVRKISASEASSLE